MKGVEGAKVQGQRATSARGTSYTSRDLVLFNPWL